MGVMAQWLYSLEVAFWLVGASMLLSGFWVQWGVPKTVPENNLF